MAADGVILPGRDGHIPAALTNLPGPRRRGTVKFFRAQGGFGFILPDEGGADVFVHHSCIFSRQPGFRTLKDGEAVEYTMVAGPQVRRRSHRVNRVSARQQA